jgi:hypothetical protein
LNNIFFIRIPRGLTGWPEMRPNRRITMIDIKVMATKHWQTRRTRPIKHYG